MTTSEYLHKIVQQMEKQQNNILYEAIELATERTRYEYIDTESDMESINKTYDEYATQLFFIYNTTKEQFYDLVIESIEEDIAFDQQIDAAFDKENDKEYERHIKIMITKALGKYNEQDS